MSYKPQKISPKFPGTVRELLHAKIREAYGASARPSVRVWGCCCWGWYCGGLCDRVRVFLSRLVSIRALMASYLPARTHTAHPQFVSDVMKPLTMDDIMDNVGAYEQTTRREGKQFKDTNIPIDDRRLNATKRLRTITKQTVQNLSGGELQRVAIALCLGKPADVYLIDEPSAYLDSEQVNAVFVRVCLVGLVWISFWARDDAFCINNCYPPTRSKPKRSASPAPR